MCGGVGSTFIFRFQSHPPARGERERERERDEEEEEDGARVERVCKRNVSLLGNTIGSSWQVAAPAPHTHSINKSIIV